MKVALLIAGYLRSYTINVEYIKESLLKKYSKVDVYLHLTKDENSQDKYFNLIEEEKDIKQISDILSPVSVIIESNFLYINDKIANNTINHWAKLYKLNTLKCINEKTTGKDYDLVIRYRPDVSFNNLDFLDDCNKIITIPSDSKIDSSKLLTSKDPYLCDAFAYGPSVAMNQYFNIFENIKHLISTHGNISETLLHHYLNNRGIQYNLKDIEYSFILSKCNTIAICGDSGSGKSVLSDILKNLFCNSVVLEGDRYHKWERSDDSWKTITHLNPTANHITKMQSDVFNLKMGNTIYQVDYDHNTGKFTSSQPISSSDNLIVCGLHSMYNNQGALYDLKIFMDTERTLKNKWKVRRDVSTRGYTIQQVLSSIAKREEDYHTHILPQKKYADVIIRFFSYDTILVDDLSKEEPVSLELLVDRKYNVDNILEAFNKVRLEYELEAVGKFYKFTFKEYQSVDFIFNKNIPLTNSYYDYISFIILNLPLPIVNLK